MLVPFVILYSGGFVLSLSKGSYRKSNLADTKKKPIADEARGASCDNMDEGRWELSGQCYR